PDCNFDLVLLQRLTHGIVVDVPEYPRTGTRHTTGAGRRQFTQLSKSVFGETLGRDPLALLVLHPEGRVRVVGHLPARDRRPHFDGLDASIARQPRLHHRTMPEVLPVRRNVEWC